MAFAKLSDSDIIEGANGDQNGLTPNAPKIGGYVQWTSQGVDQFSEPRQVRGISDDGQWAFVEGSESLPMNELTAVKSPPSPKPVTTPPPNPFREPSISGADAPFISFPLSVGNIVEIRLRKKISLSDFKRLKDLVDLSKDSLVEGEPED